MNLNLKKEERVKKLLFIVCLILVFADISLAQTGIKKKRPLPYDYGKVIINNYSEKGGLAPVVFDHWLHRAKFTCRLCHVDIGFGMKAGSTGIKASDNTKGYYCGTCHNGKMSHNNRKVFGACSNKSAQQKDIKRCERCHSMGKDVERNYDFNTFTEGFPKERFGNGINWEKAEAEGLVEPVDFIEGISIKRPPLTIPKDSSIEPKGKGMPEIIFSHKKHTIWNGCEVCHPEIFGVKKGTTKYTMIEIYEDKYCGVCHGKVAFPLIDCQRCHTKPVQSL